MLWILMAVFSAVFAGLTAVLAKCGIRKTDPDVATAIRTIVVLATSWVMVFIVGSYDKIGDIGVKSLIFLTLSGIATGASWTCYFKALAIGNVNKVVPIDKSSTILTVLLAIVCFNETQHLAIKLIGTVLLSIGIFLLIEKKEVEEKAENRIWILYAVLSAAFAALTAILAKIGISGVESNLATAVRTVIVLAFAWVTVLAQGKQKLLKNIDKRELVFIFFSGLAAGASLLCYYYAIQNGVVSVVVPIDKMSILVAVVFSYFILKEKLSKKAMFGLATMLIGTLLMAIWS